MADKKQKLEVVPPAEEPEEMPLPSDPKVIFLGGLFALALLAAVYVAAEIVLPLVLAVVLKLLLQPALVQQVINPPEEFPHHCPSIISASISGQASHSKVLAASILTAVRSSGLHE